MPLQVAAKELLDGLNAAGATRLNELGPSRARAAVRSWRLHSPQGMYIAQVCDRVIAVPAGQLTVRIYDRHPDAIKPGLIYFHGGGFVVGDLDSNDDLCRALATSCDCVVVSVDYRLAPESRFPAAVEDAWAATVWASRTGPMVGIDPSCMVVAGSSAGANLAAVVAHMSKNQPGVHLRAQLLFYPMLDFEFESPAMRDTRDSYLLTVSELRWFWSQYLGSDADIRDLRACPLRAPSQAKLPPALIITAQYDPLRDQSGEYARVLNEAGVPVEYHCYLGLMHAFMRNQDLFPEAVSALDLASKFFNKVTQARKDPSAGDAGSYLGGQ